MSALVLVPLLLAIAIIVLSEWICAPAKLQHLRAVGSKFTFKKDAIAYIRAGTAGGWEVSVPTPSGGWASAWFSDSALVVLLDRVGPKSDIESDPLVGVQRG